MENTWTFRCAKSGRSVAAYAWMPGIDTGDRASTNADEFGAAGVVFLLHGFRSHAEFNFLLSFPPDKYEVYHGSLVQKLNERGYIVFAHDHPYHGRTEGEPRGLFEGHEIMIDTFLQFVREAMTKYKLRPDLQKFCVGHSLGGALAIGTCLREPELFRAAVFSSAAVSAPKNMLGWKGWFLMQIAWAAATLVPQWEFMGMAENHVFPERHELFLNDPLTVKIGVMARSGYEFVRLYQMIAAGASELSTPFLITDGSEDTLVDKDGVEAFHAKAPVADKSCKIYEGILSWTDLKLARVSRKTSCTTYHKIYCRRHAANLLVLLRGCLPVHFGCTRTNLFHALILVVDFLILHALPESLVIFGWIQ
ncbi:Monoglyceride lipase [Porphyridium purpureum]|uniref:Monoglyceride lipase n=1 Tax=Porphyridium purpureum TaxID=35688 RepID=A0A5J4Z6Y4_PORPP|nr:Monoglyceride lipase [Porphyridium purpureum]|eukprot:POR2107..scf295_1